MANSFLVFFLVVQVVSTIVTCENIPKFPAVLVFGDSTADSGNNNYINTFLKANHDPYGKDFPGQVPTGRFSNGKLVPDFLASMLGIKETVPPFLDPNLSDFDIRTGVNFASAGSGFDDVTAQITTVIPVSQQPSYFKAYIERLKNVVGEEEAQTIINGSLVTISSGTNDFAISFYDVGVRRTQYTIDGYQDFILNRLHQFVKELYDLGCRTMIISGLPPVGCLPIQVTASFMHPFSRDCIEEQNSDARAYNDKLSKLLSEMQDSLPGSKILYADVYEPVMDMIQNPNKYGIVETKRGCCGTGIMEAALLCSPFSLMCEDPSKYLFFDSIHPSETAYKYIVESLKAQLLGKLVDHGL